MEYLSSLIFRTKITEPEPKLVIETLNTKFEIVDDAHNTYFKLLSYSIRNTDSINDYKTTLHLIDNKGTKMFSTYSKII
jgi:hypothetical protein